MQAFIYKGKIVPVNYTVKSSVVKSKTKTKKMVQTTLSGERSSRAEDTSEANKIELNCTCPPTKNKEKD